MFCRKSMMMGTAVVLMMLAAVCLPTTKSYAWWSLGFGTSYGHGGGHHGWGHSHYSHPYFGLHVSLLPSSCYTVWNGGERYYYCDGYYYRRDQVDYVVVNPPAGTVLTSVPVTYQPVVVNGTTYYTNNGVYYIYTSSGYQVVPTPAGVQPPAVAAPAATAPSGIAPAQVTATADDNYFTVNIPNDKGGYTEVTIKRSGNGFVGPQGEFYSAFPKVSQLKAMYAK